ncbi:MAG: phosphoenolpyruvate synthase [Myxococcota bacterium]
MADERFVRRFEELGSGDVSQVGGKNASLGEMIQKLRPAGIQVPGGFATTAHAYRRFIAHNDLEGRIRAEIDAMHGDRPLHEVGEAIRSAFRGAEIPPEVRDAIVEAYRALCERHEREDMDVAVRSSATAEDLPEASFAGQQESFLNIRGEEALLRACRDCYASLFTDRAIGYREEKAFDHLDVALSVGVQRMVRSDLACAGVAFTIDTDSGFPHVVVIDGAWGLGESVVQGNVDPDEFRVFKPLLDRDDVTPILERVRGDKDHKLVYGEGRDEPTRRIDTTEQERRALVLDDAEVLTLARWGRAIEQHYGRAMDIEWAKDGETGEILIVQARPETVQSQRAPSTLQAYELKEHGDALVEGLAIGDAIGAGKVFRLESADEGDRFEKGGVLVTAMTDPDWVPIMRRAAAIVTDHGGRTSHAAIVSRELGVPAVIGTGEATAKLEDGTEVTVSCAEGETGRVYGGALDFEVREIDLSRIQETRTKVMLNLADPDAGFRWWSLPADGVGLARMEFLINHVIRAHPMALLHLDRVQDDEARTKIEELTRGYEDRGEYFVEHLARGIAKLAASRHPDPVIVRFSDFKTNEYADLIGGRFFEPKEANPMLGFRGASRYYDDRYREAFGLECRAIRRVREEMGLTNVIAMVPFCRTLAEADRVLETMAEHGLERGRHGFEVYVMAEIPANIILAEEFAARFDGFSIGSNDLTQLVLGVDRDSDLLAHLFREDDEAVERSIQQLIERAHASGAKVGLCGQAPSDRPEFAAFLVEAGIDSISVDPTALVPVRRTVAEAEGHDPSG